jgi:hypothetical protein
MSFFAMYGGEAKIPVDLIFENLGEAKHHHTIHGHEFK